MEKIDAIPYRSGTTAAFMIDLTTRIDGRKIRLRRRGFATAREARTWAERELARLQLGLPGETPIRRRPDRPANDPRNWTTALVFAKLVEYWRASGRKRETTLEQDERVFKRALQPLFGERPFAGLTPRDVLTTLQLDRDMVRPTASMLLRAMVKDAPRVEAVPPPITIDCPRIKENAKIVFLTPEEIARVRDALDPSWRPMFLFSIACGARVGEIQALQWSDIDRPNRTVLIRRTLVRVRGAAAWHETKNGRARSVPLSDLAIHALEQQAHFQPRALRPRSLEEGRVFKCTVNAFYLALGAAAKAAGVEKTVSAHSLRHTFASLQVQDGTQIERISAMLGHSSLAMTMRYAHLRPDQIRESADRLSEIVTAAL